MKGYIGELLKSKKITVINNPNYKLKYYKVGVRLGGRGLIFEKIPESEVIGKKWVIIPQEAIITSIHQIANGAVSYFDISAAKDEVYIVSKNFIVFEGVSELIDMKELANAMLSKKFQEKLNSKKRGSAGKIVPKRVIEGLYIDTGIGLESKSSASLRKLVSLMKEIEESFEIEMKRIKETLVLSESEGTEKVRKIGPYSMGKAYQKEEKGSGSISFPLIKIGDINRQFISLPENKVILNKRPAKKDLVEKGDILIVMTGSTTGKAALWPFAQPALLNQRIIKIRPDNRLESEKYINVLRLFEKKMKDKGRGVGVINLTIGELLDIELPVIKDGLNYLKKLRDAEALSKKFKERLDKVKELGIRL